MQNVTMDRGKKANEYMFPDQLDGGITFLHYLL